MFAARSALRAVARTSFRSPLLPFARAATTQVPFRPFEQDAFAQFPSRSFSSSPEFVEGCCANDAAAAVRKQLPDGWTPHVGMILGSGMGEIAESIEVEAKIPYGDIPDFPVSTVSGHSGQLILGKLNGLNVACFQGRVHLYEGIDPKALRVPIYTLKLLGCEQLFVTTAVGSLMPGGVMPGDLVVVDDHINLQARSPLIGPNDPIGPRFVDMGDAYDYHLRTLVHSIGRENNIRIYEVRRKRMLIDWNALLRISRSYCQKNSCRALTRLFSVPASKHRQKLRCSACSVPMSWACPSLERSCWLATAD